MKESRLQMAADRISPCKNDDFGDICEDVESYPENILKLVLYRHKLFSNKKYFEKLFGKPCTRVKPSAFTTRQGFDLQEKSLCETREKFLYPKIAKNVNGDWKLIVNTDDYRQGVSVNRCLKQIEKGPCLYAGSEGNNPEATECRQMYSKQSLLSVSKDGTIDYDTFPIASACVCHIVEKDYFYFKK